MDSRTKNRKTKADIARLARCAFGDVGIAAGSITELTAGWFNVIYALRLTDGRDVILKIAPPADVPVLTYEDNIMSTEVATLQRLYDEPGIPVPAVHYYDATRQLCDADYFFMERVPGKMLSDIKADLSTADLLRIERETGQILCAMNGQTGPFFGYPGNPNLQGTTWRETFSRMFNALLEDAETVGVSFVVPAEELRQTLTHHASALAEVAAPCLVHWDLWDSNIMVDAGKVTGIIDFERVVWSDPLMEAQFRLLPEQGITESMRAYGKTEFTESERRRCELYSVYLGMIMCIESKYRAYDSDEVATLGAGFMARALRRLGSQHALAPAESVKP